MEDLQFVRDDREGEGDRDGGGNSASEVFSTSDKGVTGFDFGVFVFFMLARVCSYVRTGIFPCPGSLWMDGSEDYSPTKNPMCALLLTRSAKRQTLNPLIPSSNVA